MLVNGTNSNDTLFGTTSDEEINGRAGDDLIFDKSILDSDIDAISGTEDDDLILGGLGDDTLVAGVGNDTLEGGTGADLFVPNIFDNNIGRSKGDFKFTVDILDFNPEEGDRLDVSDLSNITNVPNRNPSIDTANNGLNNYNISEFETIQELATVNNSGVVISIKFNGDENITTLAGIYELNEEHFILSQVNEDDTILVGGESDHFGGLGNDVFIASAAVPSSLYPVNNRLFGEGGNDTFYLGYGNDFVWGGSGIDTVFIIGERSDYEISSTQPGITTVNYSSYNGKTLYDVENIGFISPSDLHDLYWETISVEDLEIDTISIDTPEQNDSQPLLTPDEIAEIERKEAYSSAQPTDGDDVLTGTNDDDFVVGSVGNDIGRGLAGNDEYFWENKPENSGGSFTIEDTEGDLDIVNIINENPSQTIVTRDEDDIILTLSGGSTVVLTDQFSDPQFEQVRFDFETVLTPQDLIERIDTIV